MFVLVLGMSLSVGLAVVIVCVVAVPARREGRDLLTPKGGEIVSQVREKTGSVVETAREARRGRRDRDQRRLTGFLTRARLTAPPTTPV